MSLGVILSVGVAPLPVRAQSSESAAQPGPESQPHARAQRLLYSGQIAPAIAVWDEALKQEPRNWDMLAAAGAVLYADGQFARGATYLAQAAQITPDDVTLRLFLGTALYFAGAQPQAKSEFQRILASQAVERGTAQIARDKLSGSYFEDEAAAEAALAAKVGAPPAPGASWIAQFFDVNWIKPRPDLHDGGSGVAMLEAVVPFKRPVFTGGDSIRMYGRSALFQIVPVARHRYLVTVRAWRGTPEEKHSAALVRQLRLFEFFLYHVRSGSPKEALQEKAKSFDRSHEDKPAEAAEAARAALRLAPDDAQAHYQLGHSLANLRQLETAAREQHAVLARWPDFARAHFELGVIEAMQKHNENAVGEFLAAIRGDPILYEAYLNLALTYVQLGRIDKACDPVAQAKELWPSGLMPPPLKRCDEPGR